MAAIKSRASLLLSSQKAHPCIRIVLGTTTSWTACFLTEGQIKEALSGTKYTLFVKPAEIGLAESIVDSLVSAHEKEAELMARAIHLHDEMSELVGLRAAIDLYRSIITAAVDGHVSRL
jgi:hypothetical protein